MILNVYAIKDTVVGAFLNPFLQHNDAQCIRTAKEALNTPGPNELNKNAKDKQLYKLGQFNDVTGEIESKIEFLVNIIDLKEVREDKKGE